MGTNFGTNLSTTPAQPVDKTCTSNSEKNTSFRQALFDENEISGIKKVRVNLHADFIVLLRKTPTSVARVVLDIFLLLNTHR